jgi:hypothetical protein
MIWIKYGIRNVKSVILLNQHVPIIVKCVTNVFFIWIIIVVGILNFISINIFIAWINNCIGMENQRFFILFLLYLLIGIIYNLISIMCIWNHLIYVCLSYFFFIYYLINLAIKQWNNEFSYYSWLYFDSYIDWIQPLEHVFSCFRNDNHWIYINNVR